MATVTDTLLYYEGSIAIDKRLLEASGIILGEKVSVLNFNNGERFETYTIAGKPGEISLRGPAAKLGKKGDKIIILTYAMMGKEEALKFKPTIVHVDKKNKIK
jgi:aspartate 1-decarboxylase